MGTLNFRRGEIWRNVTEWGCKCRLLRLGPLWRNFLPFRAKTLQNRPSRAVTSTSPDPFYLAHCGHVREGTPKNNKRTLCKFYVFLRAFPKFNNSWSTFCIAQHACSIAFPSFSAKSHPVVHRSLLDFHSILRNNLSLGFLLIITKKINVQLSHTVYRSDRSLLLQLSVLPGAFVSS